jgi:hypothetical protein
MAKYDLLSVDRDAKSKKGKAYGWLTALLYLAPAREADGVHDLCGGRSPECTLACLNCSGLAEVYPTIQQARIAKTLDYLADFGAFCARLERDTDKFLVECESRGLKPAERLNGTSDQPKLARAMARRYPEVPFYDYTKLQRPWERTMENYHLTYSFSGTNLKHCMKALEHNINVAVVFRGAKPRTWHGVRVIDGDRHDLRFLDPKGVIVGLREKGHIIQHLPAGGFVQIERAA